MSAYYNEIDPKAAAWLRELIRADLIAPGIVDERSIEDIAPNELAGYTQHHFFAGIGGWSYALRLAGWPDDRPVWTGSCPCQPFSAAGKGAGFADERHLWPAWFHLIRECRPGVVLGEQVASSDGLGWFDLVRADLEGADYACGGVDICSAGFTDTDLRQRLYWAGVGQADASRTGLAQRVGNRRVQPKTVFALAGQAVVSGSVAGGMGDSELPEEAGQRQHGGQVVSEQVATRLGLPSRLGGLARPVEWVACGDGKYRPIEPGTFPLAANVPARLVRLRGYGNAINAEAAAAFIEAVMASLETRLDAAA